MRGHDAAFVARSLTLVMAGLVPAMTNEGTDSTVMPGFMPGIHVFPAMTQ